MRAAVRTGAAVSPGAGSSEYSTRSTFEAFTSIFCRSDCQYSGFLVSSYDWLWKFVRPREEKSRD